MDFGWMLDGLVLRERGDYSFI